MLVSLRQRHITEGCAASEAAHRAVIGAAEDKDAVGLGSLAAPLLGGEGEPSLGSESEAGQGEP